MALDPEPSRHEKEQPRRWLADIVLETDRLVSAITRRRVAHDEHALDRRADLVATDGELRRLEIGLGAAGAVASADRMTLALRGRVARPTLRTTV